MGTDVQPPSGQSTTNPQADRFTRGPDAGLYFIGVIAVLAFISMIAVLFWVASRENSAPVAALPTSSPLPGEQEGVVLLPIVSGQSTTEPQAEIPLVPTQAPPTMAPAPTGASDGQDSQSATASAPLQSGVPASTSQSEPHPFRLWSLPHCHTLADPGYRPDGHSYPNKPDAFPNHDR